MRPPSPPRPLGASPAASVCVLGSANMDLVAIADRIPAVGETVAGSRFLQVPGGKGANQALAAARAGATVHMLGAVGSDDFGTQIRRVLAADGVDVSGLATVDMPTGTAHILVDRAGDNIIVVVPGANGGLDRLTDTHRDAIASSQVLLLQLEVPLAVVRQAAAFARAHGTTVVLTPAPVIDLPDDLLADVDVLVPNEHELAGLTGRNDPVDAARHLLRAGVGEVIVTLGPRGCLHVDAAETTAMAAPRVAAVDTTAAGDTFVGNYAAARAGGGDTRALLRWATAAAALSVQREGASSSMPRRPEIEAALTTGAGVPR